MKMVEKDHRIIVLYPDSPFLKEHNFLWSKDVYVEGSYANKDKLNEMEEWNVNEININGGNGRIFELSWTLTTQDSGILSLLLLYLLFYYFILLFIVIISLLLMERRYY